MKKLHNFTLAMVNRAQELSELASANILNLRVKGGQPIDRQQVALVVAGQLYGTGKTYLGYNAPEKLVKNPEAMEALQKLHTDEEISYFTTACPLYVDLRWHGCLGNKSERGVEIKLAMALFEEISKTKPQLSKQEFFATFDWKTVTLTDVVQYCRSLFEKDQYIYICWDEVMSDIVSITTFPCGLTRFPLDLAISRRRRRTQRNILLLLEERLSTDLKPRSQGVHVCLR